MRIRNSILLILTTLFSLTSAIAPAIAQPIAIGENFQSTRREGQTGGSVSTPDCGNIARQPNQVLQVDRRLDYLRLSVAAAGGQPTLLVEGPNGRFCILADGSDERKATLSGVWLPGRYEVYIGDRSDAQHAYTLSVSRER